MLDNGSSLPRISSSNEVSEASNASKVDATSSDAVDASAVDDVQPKIPNANKWTVSFIRFS